MERAPVPPHERTWRHPSELAASARAELVAEPASSSAKLLTISVGTLTLLALAVVVVTFTPDRVDHGLADRATPSTVASALLQAGRTFVAELTSTGDDERASVTTLAASPTGGAPTTSGSPTTTEAAGTGEVATVLVELHGAGTLVALQVSRTTPTARDKVTALTDPPVHMSYGRTHATLVAVAAPDGTVVVDAGGRVVGVWTTDGDDGGARLVPAAELSDLRAAAPHDVATTVGRD